MQQRCFSQEAPDCVVHFQVLHLGRQLYVWVAAGAPNLGGLYAATPTRMDAVPSATVLQGGKSNEDGCSMAQRLAAKTKLPVVLAYGLPANTPTLKAFAERRVLQELETMPAEQQTA